jgi:hypothetical protein
MLNIKSTHTVVALNIATFNRSISICSPRLFKQMFGFEFVDFAASIYNCDQRENISNAPLKGSEAYTSPRVV